MATYKRLRFLLMATDPVHVGTGGYRLGRVDNSIAREPGTRIPKIPGTSLHGAARSYAARLYESPEAAGQDHHEVTEPEKNPVCYTFGYIKKGRNKNGDDKKVTAYSGVINIFDAHVLLFPVHTMYGPVWVSTVERLQDARIDIGGIPSDWPYDAALFSWDREDPLNLGWLMVKKSGKASLENLPKEWQRSQRWQTVKDRIVLVQDSLFSQVVNSNLEVRTSVAIDSERGAAVEGALFTYEALPRATFLTFEMVLDDYRREGAAWSLGAIDKTNHGNALPGTVWSGPVDVATAGLRMIEWLGVGGMGTRGFGRMALVGEPMKLDFWPGEA